MEEQVHKVNHTFMSFSCREGSCDGNCCDTVNPWVAVVKYYVCRNVPLAEIKDEDITKDFKLSSACVELEYRNYLKGLIERSVDATPQM